MFRERKCYQHKLQVNLLFDQTGHPTPGQHDRLWYWESENCHFVHLLQKKSYVNLFLAFTRKKNYSGLFLCAVAFTVFFYQHLIFILFWNDDSNWSLLLLEASKYSLKTFICKYFRLQDCIKHYFERLSFKREHSCWWYFFTVESASENQLCSIAAGWHDMQVNQYR